MSDDAIKEFMVKLGVDDTGINKFEKQLTSINKGVMAFGEAMSVAAASVAFAVTKMASDFDNLYWSSKNLGSSAGDIKGLGYAFSQLGGSASDAGAVMTSLANFTQSYGAGAAGFLTRLGVDPRHVGDAADTLIDLEHIFQRMAPKGDLNGLAHANAIAGRLGISPAQLRIMLRDTGAFEKQLRDFAKGQGLDLDQAAASGNQFMTALRGIGAELGLVGDSVGVEAIKQIVPVLQTLAHWVDDMAAGKKLSGIAGQFQNVTNDVGDLIESLHKLAETQAFGTFAMGMIRAFDDVIKLASHFVNGVTDILNGDWAGARREFNAKIDDYKDHPDALSPPTGSKGASAPAGSRSSGSNANNPGNLRTPGGHGFQHFGSPADGVRAMGRQLQRYEFRDHLETLSQIIRKYAPASENDTASYIRYVAHRLGINPDAVLNLGDTGTLSSLMSAMMHLEKGHEVFSPDQIRTMLANAAHPPWEGHQHVAGANVRVAMSQTNNYHNHGADPRALAQEIGKQQDHNNQKMVAGVSVYQW